MDGTIDRLTRVCRDHIAPPILMVAGALRAAEHVSPQAIVQLAVREIFSRTNFLSTGSVFCQQSNDPARRDSALDIALQIVVFHRRLVVQRLHDVTNGNDAHQFALVEDRQVANAPVGH